MNFQNPASFLWALPLSAAIIALYLLRMRRRDVQVPAVFLWPQRTEEIRANALIQKLRFSWLLVLQLLALTVLVLALARPQLKQRGLSGHVTVAVLDASASMGAVDVKPSRFGAALASVRDMIGSARAGDRLALIEAGPTPRVVFPLSNDPEKQRDSLSTVHTFDAEADMGEALRLAAAIAASTDGAKIVVLSDGAFEPVTNFTPGKAGVVYQPFGESGENLVVQALGSAQGASGLTAYCGVKNVGLQPAKSIVTITADGKPIDSDEAVIAPGKTWGKTVKVPAGVKVLEAKLGSGGQLAADDSAVALTDSASALRVLLVSKGDMFLERALALDPRVTLDKAAQVPESQRAGSAGESTYDVVVFDGVDAEPVKAAGVLAFGCGGSGLPVQTKGTVKAPEFETSETNALLEGVDLSNVYVETMQRVEPTGRGRVLAEAKQGPLVVASDGKQRCLYVAFEPLKSDFPLSYGFPIMIGNALDFLAGKEASGTLAVRASQSFVLNADGNKSAQVEGPTGTVTVDARDGRIIVRQAERVGRYKVTIGKRVRTVWANFRSPLESQIMPKQELSLGQAKVAVVSELSRFEDFWRWAILAGLMILAFEWWFFASRS